MVKDTDILRKELEVLYRVAQTIYSLELSEVLEEIVTITSEITHSDSCLIYLIDAKKGQLTLRASKNQHEDLLQKITLKMGEGITGWVAKEQKVVAIAEGAGNDPRFKLFRSLPEDKFEAFLSVPIVNKKGVVGVINAQHKEKHIHSESEVNLLAAIGKLVGGAVENALLIEEALELRESLELRRLTEKAKGILMKRRGLSEDEAYRLLQKQSMNERKSFREVVEAVIIAEKLNLAIDKV